MTHEDFIKAAKRRQAFALLLTTGLAPVFGWLYAGPVGALWAGAAWIVFVVLPRTTGTRLLGFAYHSFFVPEQLPWTMVNLVLAILIGCMQFGMDVAFYAALVGVPIVVLTLIVAVMEPDLEAELIPDPAASPRPEVNPHFQLRTGHEDVPGASSAHGDASAKQSQKETS